MKQLVDKAGQTFGRVDVMINNAGLMPPSPLERLKVDDWPGLPSSGCGCMVEA